MVHAKVQTESELIGWSGNARRLGIRSYWPSFKGFLDAEAHRRDDRGVSARVTQIDAGELAA